MRDTQALLRSSRLRVFVAGCDSPDPGGVAELGRCCAESAGRLLSAGIPEDPEGECVV